MPRKGHRLKKTRAPNPPPTIPTQPSATQPSLPKNSFVSKRGRSSLKEITRFFGTLDDHQRVTDADPTHMSFRVHAEEKLKFGLFNAYAPQTDSNYSYGIKRFLKFAVRCGIPEHMALPPDPHILCLFIAEGIGRTGISMVKGHLSALAAWHKVNGITFVVPPQIAVLKKAIAHYHPVENKKPPRKPISPGMMECLAESWSKGSPKHACALAIAVAAWTGQLRLGELVPPSLKELDVTRLPKRNDWRLSKRVDKASTLTLPWTKTTKEKPVVVNLQPHDFPLDPSTAMLRHFLASKLDTSHLICEYRPSPSSKPVVMDKPAFMELCNEVWSSKGWPRFTGHSFRIGGTTALLAAGVNPNVVKMLGRWSSDAYLLYWRNLEEIFATNVANIKWVDFEV